MNLKKLIKFAAAGEIQTLEFHSLEGGFYIVRAQLKNSYRTLLDDANQSVRLRSTTQLRDLLEGSADIPCVLIQHVVHDEMCGAREGAIEPLRLPFSLTQTW